MSTSTHPERDDTELAASGLTYREAINAAMEDEMEADDAVVLLGEDVASDGGVFKTNASLIERFGVDRVRNTPICENGFVGVALGMAVTGLRPIVEIMFSDFLPSAADAIVNELAKFRFMSGGQCDVPVTIRSIGGATGRFGTQHSATGESWYIGLPGLLVATAGSPAGAYDVLRAAIQARDPVLFFEHKGLYSRRDVVVRGEGSVRVGGARILQQGTDLSVVATLLMADRALQAARRLAETGLSIEVIDPQWLRPFDYETIEASLSKTGRLLIVEEQVHAGGWGATLVSNLFRSGALSTPPRVMSLDGELPLPYTPVLEDEMVPSVDAIAAEMVAMLAEHH